MNVSDRFVVLVERWLKWVDWLGVRVLPASLRDTFLRAALQVPK